MPLFRTEAEFTTAVITLARSCGYLVYHARPAVVRSGKWATHMQGDPGLPDIIAVHPEGRLVVAELKMPRETQAKGRPTAQQQEWLDAMKKVARHAGQFAVMTEDGHRAESTVIVRVWRPEDYDREIVPTFAGAW